MHWRTYEETAKEREKARSRPASASPPLGEFFALALSTAAKSETNKATIARLCIPISNCAGPAKRFNRSLQSLHGGEPKGYRRRMKAAKRLGQRRNTLSITAGIPRRPSKPWLDEHTKRNRAFADRKHGHNRVGRGVDHQPTDKDQPCLAKFRHRKDRERDRANHRVGRDVDHRYQGLRATRSGRSANGAVVRRDIDFAAVRADRHDTGAEADHRDRATTVLAAVSITDTVLSPVFVM
jgi:hypothetical protein